MKLIEMMSLQRKSLEILQKHCINIKDVRYVPMYEEYSRLMKEGCKKSYIVAHLSEMYSISERRVYYLISKFESDCNISAV